MLSIKTIPDKELEQDLLDSYQDIRDCTHALELGVTQYSGGSVQERLDENKRFVEIITAEIKRRRLIQGKEAL